MKKNDSDHQFSYMPLYMSLGMCIGLAIGAAMDHISVGMCMGLGIGMCLGSALDNANKAGKEKNEGDQKQSAEEERKEEP